jgi:hypothetical protein
MRNLFILLCILTSACTNAQDLKYELICVKDTLSLGKEVPMSLSVIGTDNLLGENDSRISSIDRAASFNFYAKPKTLGKHVFGPYKIKINGRELSSNTVSIYVVEPDKNKDFIELHVAEKINVGDTVKISLRSKRSSLKLKLKSTNKFKVLTTSTSTSYMVVNGKPTNKYEKTFFVKFLSPGDIKVSKDFFENVSPGVIVPEKMVTVVN